MNGTIIYEHCYCWTSDTCIYWVCIDIVFFILPLTQDWDAQWQLKLGVHTQSCYQEPATHCWFLEIKYVTDTSCNWGWGIYYSESVELSHVLCAGLTKIYFWFKENCSYETILTSECIQSRVWVSAVFPWGSNNFVKVLLSVLQTFQSPLFQKNNQSVTTSVYYTFHYKNRFILSEVTVTGMEKYFKTK